MNYEILNIVLVAFFLFGLSYCIATIFKIKYDISSLQEEKNVLGGSLSRYKNDFESRLEKNHDDLINIKTSQVSQKNEVDKLKTMISEYTNSNQKKK